MIKRALILRKPIESWVHENAELWSLSLLPTDWALLKRICDLLEVGEFQYFILLLI